MAYEATKVFAIRKKKTQFTNKYTHILRTDIPQYPPPLATALSATWTVFDYVIYRRVACEQALKVNWESASMSTNEFEYLRLISLVRCYNLYVSAELYICQLLKHYA
jgi:hypothetical protein